MAIAYQHPHTVDDVIADWAAVPQDLHTVDDGIEAHLYPLLSRPGDWDVVIAHFLGVVRAPRGQITEHAMHQLIVHLPSLQFFFFFI